MTRRFGGRRTRPVSLRLRVTAVCSCVIVLCCAVLTVGNNASAVRLADTIEMATILEPAALPAVNDPAMPASPEGTAAAETLQASVSLEARSGYRAQSAIALVAIVALGILAVYWLVGRSMASLHDVSDHIGRLSASDLGDPVPVPRGPQEVVELAESFNAMTRRLNEAFDMQKGFAQSAAHELRTPLCVAKTNVQLFRKRLKRAEGAVACDLPDVDVAGLLDTVELQIDRLTAVVNDLLAVVNIRDVRPLELVDVRLLSCEARDLVCAAGAAADTAAGDRVVVEEFEGHVAANRVLLGRVLANLIDNALRYGRPGGTVRVSGRHDGDSLLVFVDDEGAGIAPEERERVFEPFYRADASRSRVSGGVGLGLAVARAVVRAHGGELTAGDAPGGGCRFTVRLPRDRGAGGV